MPDTADDTARARAEQLFAAAFAGRDAGDTESDEDYENRRYHDAVTTLLVDAWRWLADERGWPEDWPRWPDVQALTDDDEVAELVRSFLEQRLARAGLLP